MFIASVGMGNPAGAPRFTFDQPDLLGGVSLVPLMVGMFAMSEVLRFAVSKDFSMKVADGKVGNVFKGMWDLMVRYPKSVLRGSVLGTLVGALPGAGADIAAWMSYAMSKKMSRQPEKFGTGHPEGIVESGAANNSALAGAWIPALVFGIPGDSITAIVSDVGIMLVFGLLACLMEENGFPVAPAVLGVLGVVLGGMLEEHFVTSMIKSDGQFLAFFERPIAGTLRVLTIVLWLLPLVLKAWRRRQPTMA